MLCSYSQPNTYQNNQQFVLFLPYFDDFRRICCHVFQIVQVMWIQVDCHCFLHPSICSSNCSSKMPSYERFRSNSSSLTADFFYTHLSTKNAFYKQQTVKIGRVELYQLSSVCCRIIHLNVVYIPSWFQHQKSSISIHLNYAFFTNTGWEPRRPE